MIKSRIVADSINPLGDRITTFVITFPRIVLAELNTHRALTRNSASSRAIPFKKMVEAARENPFIPIAWQEDHKGMQGTKYLKGTDAMAAKHTWLIARDTAVLRAQELNYLGVTKQICNRLLEPFMWHTAIVTATEWENFFALRAHPDAEIHIAKLAELMLNDLNISSPNQLQEGEWHIPFGGNINLPSTIPIEEGLTLQEGLDALRVKIAVARCARVSYLNFDGKDDYQADIILHDRLLKSGHMSPFEHCAQAMDTYDYAISSFNADDGDEGSWGWSGNFKGWVQYRKFFANENRKDDRVSKIFV